ncbi:MAG: hypothetical protein P1V97_29515 [Planctomycetota bacterium]|nr:hypothetical protein [Planctomycetota bacterium]
MDKLKREAERSGDVLKYALELRRQGQDRAAKRLLQDLAWDHFEGADDALELLYPLDPELIESLSSLEDNQSQFSSIPNYFGSLDPRVNTRLDTIILKMLEDFSSDDVGLALFTNWLESCRKRTLLERLFADNEHFGARLTWADPLKEELNALIANAMTFREDPDRGNIGRLGDLTLGWHIAHVGSSAQHRRWTEGLNPVTWREELAVAEGSHNNDFNEGEGSVRPTWFPTSICPNRACDARSFALHRYVFVDSGTPRSHFKWDHDLVFLKVENLDDLDLWAGFYVGDKGRRAYVSAWQDLVGDRVIRWTEDQFLIIWEYGALAELLGRLACQDLGDRWPEGFPLCTVTMGTATLTDDWFGAIDEARDRQKKAKKLGKAYLDEDLG